MIHNSHILRFGSHINISKKGRDKERERAIQRQGKSDRETENERAIEKEMDRVWV